jgi:hypothetical protein
MRPAPEEWDSLRDSLRLAASAADLDKAAEKLRPAFELRLKDLGYGPLAIAHAFSILTGPAAVSEALTELAHAARMERSAAVPLDFETVGEEPDLPLGHSLAIAGVERDDRGIRIRYAICPPLPQHAPGPRCEARDDHEREYVSLGSGIGLAEPVDRTTGFLTMPLPRDDASLPRVRMSWSQDPASLWGRPGHELRITLRGSA